MAHCTKCGAVTAENAAFCGSCGAAQDSVRQENGAIFRSAGNSGESGAPIIMDEKAAGALCYLILWVTGIIFLITDKRSYVRFHATQSIVVFGALSIAWYVIGLFFGVAMFAGGWMGFSFGLMILRALQLAWVVLWAFLMIKAYQGERFRIPMAADFAEKIFGKA
jgi:uncharacterized membrane protein